MTSCMWHREGLVYVALGMTSCMHGVGKPAVCGVGYDHLCVAWMPSVCVFPSFLVTPGTSRSSSPSAWTTTRPWSDSCSRRCVYLRRRLSFCSYVPTRQASFPSFFFADALLFCVCLFFTVDFGRTGRLLSCLSVDNAAADP